MLNEWQYRILEEAKAKAKAKAKALSDVKVKEGKMHKLLGLEPDQKISDFGSADAAVKKLVSAVGKDKAASMINFAANISKDKFLKDMQSQLTESLNEGLIVVNKKQIASIADAFARYLVGEPEIAIKQLKKIRTDVDFDSTTGGFAKEYNTLFLSLFDKISKVIRDHSTV